MRQAILLLHRCVGLAMTVFLVNVGLTGSLLAFYGELDRLISPQLYPALRPALARLDMASLAERAEQIVPQAKATSVYLRDPERAEVSVSATPASLDFDTLILDPYTGVELGRYTWGDITQGAVNLMPFIYRLHDQLALGSVGLWALGITALLWTLDCFVGFYLTLPARRKSPPSLGAPSFSQRWTPAWRIKRGASRYRLNFDLHRAGGLWLWLVLLIFAWSGVYMNLWDTVYTWTTRAVFDYRPAWTEIAPLPAPMREPTLSWRAAQTRATNLMNEQAQAHGFKVIEPVALRFHADTGQYSYQVRTDRDVQDKRGMSKVYVDARGGKLTLLELPTGQYNGNTVTSWLYALHMANILGLPYRIFVSLLGLVIVMLAVTGVVIWLRKRRVRWQR